MRFWPLAGLTFGVAAVAGLLWLAFSPVKVERQGRDAAATSENVRYKTSESRQGALKSPVKPNDNVLRKRVAKSRLTVTPDWYAKLPAEDQELGKRIQDAQDNGDRDAVFDAADAALQSKSVEVRQAAVDALSLQGESAVPRLLKFFGDSNNDVADSAYAAWDNATDQMESEAQRVESVKAAVKALGNSDRVATAVAKIENVELPRAIGELAELAKGSGPAAKAARASYESVTGEKWQSWSAAQLKLISVERQQ